MLFPPLPRNLEASFRDLGSERPETRVSALADVVRHARVDAAARERAAAEIPKLLDDERPDVRAAAATALADVGATSALPRLLVAVEDKDALVRQMVLSALGELGDARAAPRLSRALSDERPEVRYQAIIAYARTEPDAGDVAKALARAFADEDPAIAHIALRVAEERLDASPPRPEGEDARGQEGYRGSGAHAGKLEAAAERLLDADHPDVALAAAIFLAKSGHEGARAKVLAVVAGQGPPVNKEDEAAAVELAGELGLREALPHLERRARGLARFVRDTCALSARIALARLGDERACRSILDDLGSRNGATRSAAIIAAGRARLEAARPELERVTGDVEVLAREALALLDRSARP